MKEIQGNKGTYHKIKEIRIGEVNFIEVGFASYKNNREKRIVNIRLRTNVGNFNLICNWWQADQKKNYDALIKAIKINLAHNDQEYEQALYKLRLSTTNRGYNNLRVEEIFHIYFSNVNNSIDPYFQCANSFDLETFKHSDRNMKTSPREIFSKLNIPIELQYNMSFMRGDVGGPP